MESANDFMVRFLHDKAQAEQEASRCHRLLEQAFFAPDYQKLIVDRKARRGKTPEQIKSVEVSDGCAKVITSGPSRRTPKHYRYHLCQSGQSWQINEIEWECILCHGVGMFGSGACQACEGKGWRDPIKRDA